MKDRELYQQVLGLELPWVIERLELDAAQKRVDISLEHDLGVRWSCPQCGRASGCYDHAPERSWRHLDTCQFQTHLHARIPRVNCPEHGVAQVAVLRAEPHGRFTLLFERMIIDVRQCTTVAGACVLLGVSWDEAFAVMERAVARGQARKQAQPVPRIAVDEKAFRKGHSYVAWFTIRTQTKNDFCHPISPSAYSALLRPLASRVIRATWRRLA